MNEININKTIVFIKKSIKSLLEGKYPITDFITSKTLKAKYANRETQSHVVLADRMKKRDPGNAPEVNERIPYVAIVTEKPKNKKLKLLQGDKIEHPDYILEHNLKIDYLFYLTNQIKNPTIQFLELVHDDPGSIFRPFIISEENKRNGITELTKFGFTKKNKNDLDDIYDIDIGNNIEKPDIDFEVKHKLKSSNKKEKK